MRIYRFRKADPIKEKATRDLADGRKYAYVQRFKGMRFLVQRILTGLEDRYEKETDSRKKLRLAEQCADTFSRLKRNERSKTYYVKQVNNSFSTIVRNSLVFS